MPGTVSNLDKEVRKSWALSWGKPSLLRETVPHTEKIVLDKSRTCSDRGVFSE